MRQFNTWPQRNKTICGHCGRCKKTHTEMMMKNNCNHAVRSCTHFCMQTHDMTLWADVLSECQFVSVVLPDSWFESSASPVSLRIVTYCPTTTSTQPVHLASLFHIHWWLKGSAHFINSLIFFWAKWEVLVNRKLSAGSQLMNTGL